MVVRLFAGGGDVATLDGRLEPGGVALEVGALLIMSSGINVQRGVA